MLVRCSASSNSNGEYPPPSTALPRALPGRHNRRIFRKWPGAMAGPGGGGEETMTDRRMGMWYEELTVGMVVQHAITRTLTETDNVLFTTMSMNPQPLHLDADFAAKTQFGRPL